MTWDSVPWFVGGGAQHSPEIARLLAYAATSGSEGIVLPTDLKVSPLDVPGASVSVSSGAALILNRAAGGTAQTYAARLVTADEIGVAATGSGAGRSDLVVAQIEDPFMPGEPWQDPADPAVGPYVFTRIVPNVPAGTTRLQDVPGYEGRSAITLARLDLPASTGTVTAAMITDLREIATPHSQRATMHAQSAGQSDTVAVNGLTQGVYTNWPKVAKWDVIVPPWATHAHVRGDVVSYRLMGQGFANGRIRAAFAGGAGTASSFDENWTGSPHRNGLAFASVIPIPRDKRGTKQTLTFEAMRSTYAASGQIDADLYTVSIADIEFVERPE